MFDKFLFVFLLISALCYSSGEDMFQFASRVLMTGAMSLACLAFLFCKPKRRILPKWPVYLMGFFLLKLYWFPYHWLSMHGVFNTFFAIIIFYLVANYAEDIRWLYRAVGIVVVLNIVYSFSHTLGYNPIFKSTGNPGGFFADTTDLAGYLILATPLMAHYLRGLGFLIPLVFATCFLHSYTAIACSFVSGIWLAIRRYKLLWLAIIALCIGTLLYQSNHLSTPNYKLSYRIELWDKAITMALQKPLSGRGVGRFIEVAKAKGAQAFTAKNEYFEFAFEVGIVAALCFTGFIFYMLFKRYMLAVRTNDLTLISISLAVFAIALLLQSHLRNPKISPTVMAVLGWFYILTENKRKES